MKIVTFYLSLILCTNILSGELKNLQILDYKSEKDLKKYMKTISKDLGVKCSFCHDLNDKSIDKDHKIIAREMMKMQKNLNKHFFTQIGDSLLKYENSLQISCWTCHLGSKHPQLIRQND